MREEKKGRGGMRGTCSVFELQSEGREEEVVGKAPWSVFTAGRKVQVRLLSSASAART